MRILSSQRVNDIRHSHEGPRGIIEEIRHVEKLELYIVEKSYWIPYMLTTI